MPRAVRSASSGQDSRAIRSLVSSFASSTGRSRSVPRGQGAPPFQHLELLVEATMFGGELFQNGLLSNPR